MSYDSGYRLERVELLTPLYVSNDATARKLTRAAEARLRAGADDRDAVDHVAEVLADGTYVLVEAIVVPVRVVDTRPEPAAAPAPATLEELVKRGPGAERGLLSRTILDADLAPVSLEDMRRASDDGGAA